jgi:hypothetical protein
MNYIKKIKKNEIKTINSKRREEKEKYFFYILSEKT